MRVMKIVMALLCSIAILSSVGANLFLELATPQGDQHTSDDSTGVEDNAGPAAPNLSVSSQEGAMSMADDNFVAYTDIYDLVYNEVLTLGTDLGMKITRNGNDIISNENNIAIEAKLFITEDTIVINVVDWEHNLARLVVRGVSHVYEIPECFDAFNKVTSVPYSDGMLTIVSGGNGYKIEINPIF